MKPSLLFLLVAFYACASSAQSIPGERTPIPGDEKKLLANLQSAPPGIPQAEALLELGAYYLYLPGELPEDLDRARDYSKKAKALCDSLHYTDGYNESLVLIGTVFHEEGNNTIAHQILDSALAIIEKTKLQCRAEQKLMREARALRQISTIYVSKRQYATAETRLQDLLKYYEEHKFPNKHYCLQRISLMHVITGDKHKGLYYILEAIRSMEATGDYLSAPSFYYDLGYLYREIGQFQKGVDYYQKSFDLYKKQPTDVIYELAYGISEALTKMKRPEEGIVFLKKVAVDFPPKTNRGNSLMELSFATSYRVAKQYELAEIHIKREATYKEQNTFNETITARTLGQLYIEWGKYAQAKPYLDQCLASGIFRGKALAHLHFMAFKADSAAGNYLSAIDHIMKNKALDDVEYREAKIRENQELQIKYETEKKDHEIKLHEQNVLLLTTNSRLLKQNLEQIRLRFLYDSLQKDQYLEQLNFEAAKKDKDLLLKQQSIQSLQKQDQLKQTGLRQANLIKNMTIAGIVLLLIILSLLYNQYRVKLSNSKELSRKNQSLERLVHEKEWLLKEVHHRVKNNLHTIMSLLETQSTYLKDDALTAVQNSQHRVYAMSLIHQRLYQKENSTIVDMSVYLPELISYLKESYDTRQHIQFVTDIDKIRLDISQAIPVGLILNEAVTNSIKYAFPLDRKGQIHIALLKTNEQKVMLSIRDNGTGLPNNWKELQKHSLGLKLMKGLSDDLKADFSLVSDEGAALTVEFQKGLFEREIRQNEKQVVEDIAI